MSELLAVGGVVVLRSKLLPPEVPTDAVQRSELVARVVASAASIVVIKGPPGYGKTTVARLVTDHLDAASAWVHVDAADDRRRFWAHVVAALDAQGIEVETAAASDLVDVVDRAVAAIEASDRDLVLVLDDLHEADDAGLLADLARLVVRPPARLRIILTTRIELELPVARLLARGEAIEVGVNELAFTPAEGSRFIEPEVEAGRIDESLAGEIVARVDGWPAALRLARLVVRAGRSPADVIAAVHGSSDELARYLAAEVLAGQPPAVREFLVLTSVLDELTPEACDAATDGVGALGILRRLVDEQVFTVLADPSVPTFRYHRLWSEFLRSRLDERAPDEVADVHRRLADHLAQRGDVGSSVRHRLLAGDVEAALDVLGARYVDLANRGEIDLLWSLVEMIGPETVLRHEQLAPLPAWASLNNGRYDEIDPWVESIAVVDGIAPEHRRRFELHGAVVRSNRDRHLGDLRGAVEWGARAVELAEHESDPLIVPSALAVHGAALVLRGEHAIASPLLRRAIDLGTTVGEHSAVVMAECYLAAAAADPAERSSLAQAALARCVTPELDRFHRPALAWLVLAEAALDEGRVGDAEHGVHRALEHAVAGREPAVAALVEALHARVQHRVGAERSRRAALRSAQRRVDDLVGGEWIAEQLRVARNTTRFAPVDDALPPGARELTERELTILRLLPHGLSRKELARQLFVSENTIKTHLTSIRRKLGTSGRESPVDAARQLGLLDDDTTPG